MSGGEATLPAVTASHRNDLHWVAGLLEGEGSIQISRHRFIDNGAERLTYVLWVRLGMLDQFCVQETARILGGSHRATTYKSKTRVWRWDLSSAAAGEVLATLLPYIRSPRVRAKAELGLKFQHQKIRGRPSNPAFGRPNYAAEQEDYYLRMKELNVRGKHA